MPGSVSPVSLTENQGESAEPWAIHTHAHTHYITLCPLTSGLPQHKHTQSVNSVNHTINTIQQQQCCVVRNRCCLLHCPVMSQLLPVDKGHRSIVIRLQSECLREKRVFGVLIVCELKHLVWSKWSLNDFLIMCYLRDSGSCSQSILTFIIDC